MKKQKSLVLILSSVIVAFVILRSCAFNTEKKIEIQKDNFVGEIINVSDVSDGDLLFCVNPEGNHITDVTQGYKGKQIDHVGFAFWENDQLWVIEATRGKGVVQTALTSFIQDNTIKGYLPEILIGRINIPFAMDDVITQWEKYDGLPYDSLYMPDDQAMYCSELIQKCYLDSLDQPIFPSIPMSFHDESGRITPYWSKYYERHHMTVPEGKPGTNPGQLSRDRNVKIIGRLNTEDIHF